MDLTGKGAVITGAAAGIGRACAQALAERGAHVLVVDRDESAHTVAADLGGTGIVADVGTDDGLAAVRRAIDGLADYTVLVNNAGGGDGEWRQVVKANLIATLALTRHAIDRMRTGVVVSIASIAGLGSEPHAMPAYAAAKAGVVRFTTAIQQDRGVRLGCVCPDIVDTPSSRRSRAAMSAAELADLPPVLPPEAVARAMLELVDDEEHAGRVIRCRGGEPDLDVTS